MAPKTSFAAAQERVLQRRGERERELRSSSSLPSASANGAHLHPLLNRATAPPRRAWNQVKGREGTNPLFRVGQVDAELLDEELLGLFNEQIRDALKYFGSQLRDDWSHEIQLALRAILFKLSIWDHNASYGASLQNLKYVDARSRGPVHSDPTRWQKTLYGIFTVGGRYAWDKWESRLLDQESSWDEVHMLGTTPPIFTSLELQLPANSREPCFRLNYQPSPRARMFSKITNSFTTLHTAASFLSFLIFLINGRYRTLTDRVLRMRLSPPSTQVSREVSFEYLNRQLVWHAFTEFLLFLLPLVGISRWRRWLSRFWRRAVNTLRESAGDDGEDTPDSKEKRGELSFLPERTCAICYQEQNSAAAAEGDVMGASGAGGISGSAQTDIVNPYETMPCACIYCFVCIAQVLEGAEGDGWVCLRCGELVKQCQPWQGDVVVDEVQQQPQSVESSPKKSVEFVEGDELISDGDDDEGDEDSEDYNEEEAEDSGNPWSSAGEEDEEEEEEQDEEHEEEEEDDEYSDHSRISFGGR
ncbi:Urmylation protein [Ascosphaera pollenicola]|nr:Urmylation protein [Ascosphaera pollenicola]